MTTIWRLTWRLRRGSVDEHTEDYLTLGQAAARRAVLLDGTRQVVGPYRVDIIELEETG